MQYQLIHHLMPTMPRYRYKKIKPLVKQFAMDNDVDYRDMDEIPLVLRNIALYREVARAPADSTARSMPPVSTVFDQEQSKVLPPAQRVLCLVAHHRRWLREPSGR